MKNKDLITELQRHPEETEVVIFDLEYAEKNATGEPSSLGLHKEFDINPAYDQEDLDEVHKKHPNAKNFLCLTFDGERKEMDSEEVENLINKFAVHMRDTGAHIFNDQSLKLFIREFLNSQDI